MAIKKVIELDVKSDTKQADKSLKDIKTGLADVKQQAEKTFSGDSVKKLNKEMGNTTKVAVDVRAKLRDIQNKMAEIGDVGSAEFQALAREAGAYKDQMNNANAAIKSMSADFPKLQIGVQALGAMGAAAGAATAGMALFGTENEEAAKAIQKMMAITTLMSSVTQFSNMLSDESALGLKFRTVLTNLKTKSDKKSTAALLSHAIGQKAVNVAQKAFGISTGVASKGLKIFRGALIGTGIGAIVVGIGFLIANFDTVSKAVKNAVAKFRDMGTGMKILLYPITALIAAYDMLTGALQYFGLIDSEETKKAKANAAERIVSSEKEGEATGKRYDYEIAKANAAGKNTLKLEQQKRHAFRKSTKEQIADIELLAKLNGKATDEQLEKIKALEDAIIKSTQETNLAVIKNNKESNDKNLSNHKQHLADKKAAEDIHQAVLRELEAHRISLIEDDFERERETILNNFAIKREDLLANFKGTEEDKAALRSAYNTQEQIALNESHAKELEAAKIRAQELSDAKGVKEFGDLEDPNAGAVIKEFEAEDFKGKRLLEIKKKWNDANEEMRDISQSKEFERTAAGLENASSALNSVNDLSNMLTDLAVQKAGDNEAAAEAARKKGFERSKKIQIAMAVIQGVQGVMAAFTAGSAMGPAGVVMGPLMGALAAVTAGVNIAKIKATKYGGGGSVPSGGGGSGGRAPSPPSFNIVGNSSDNQLATSLGGQEDPVIKTYVVSEDVTTAQSLDRNRVNTATL